MSIFLALGGNIEPKAEYLQKAKEWLMQQGITILKESSIYQTPPFGPVPQDDFLNQVIEIKTELSAPELLKLCLEIELQLGRERKIHWGPRTIDIDLLCYHDQILNTPELTLPHPGIPERRFVLEPLAEIAPDFIHPILKKDVQMLVKECPDQSKIQRIKN